MRVLQWRRWCAGTILMVLVAGVPAVWAEETAAGFPSVTGGIRDWKPDDDEDITALKHVEVQTSDHGVASKWKGVPLTAVLAKIGVDLSAPLQGPSLQKVVSVRGSDGYVAAFALGEFDPSLGDRQAVLVDERDGKPLGTTDGPWRLIVPQDKREARWVRNVVSIEVGTGEPIVAATAAAAPTPFPKAAMSAAACVVWDRERSFAASVEHHDPVAFADHVSEQAAFDAGSAQPLLGRGAIVAGWKGIIEGKYFNLRWSPGIVTLGGDGSLAISHGPAWIEDLRPNAKQRFQMGEFLSTWIRDKDGQWRVLFDADTAPMQPASAEDVAKLIGSLPKECPRS